MLLDIFVAFCLTAMLASIYAAYQEARLTRKYKKGEWEGILNMRSGWLWRKYWYNR